MTMVDIADTRELKHSLREESGKQELKGRNTSPRLHRTVERDRSLCIALYPRLRRRLCNYFIERGFAT